MPDAQGAARPFLDTNVLIDAVTSDDTRHVRARDLVLSGALVGVQVLNEFVSVTRRKLGWDWPSVMRALEVFERRCGPVRPVTLATHRAAVTLAHDHGLAIYDALIVVAAQEAGCDRLLTEDLQAGRAFGTLTVVNPFA